MREYKLSPAFFPQTQRRVLIFTVPFMILAGAAGILIAGHGDRSSSAFYFTALVGIIAMIIGIRIGLRQTQQSWSSYRLIMDENLIKRTRDGLPDIMIAYNEISKITQTPGSGLTIQTSIPTRQIGVPETLENYPEFRLELQKIHVIDNAPISRTKWLLPVLLGVSIGLLTLAAFAITFLATNRYVIALTGTLLIVALLLGHVRIQRSIYLPQQVKRIDKWFGLLPPSVIAIRVFLAILGR